MTDTATKPPRKPRAQREREAAEAAAAATPADDLPTQNVQPDQVRTASGTIVAGDLHDFEGRAVKRASIKFRNTGTDLSNPLSVEPIELHHGDQGYALVHYTLVDISHPAIKEKGGELSDALERAHTLRIDVVTLVDDEFGADKITAQRRKVEELKGVLSLDLDGADGSGIEED